MSNEKKTVVDQQQMDLATRTIAPRSVQEVLQTKQAITEIMQQVMQEGVHYGIIPGCDKPSLLQPGAEILGRTFGFMAEYQDHCEWDHDRQRAWSKTNRKTGEVYAEGVTVGFFHAHVKCVLRHIQTGLAVGEGLGAANNFEPKFINRDPYEAEETVLQFARKRAYVQAVKTATAASELFTHDIEDMEGFAGEVDGQSYTKAGPESPSPSPKPSVPFEGEKSPRCPDCGAQMRKRMGRNGEFWGCSNFPTCRKTRPLEGDRWTGESLVGAPKGSPAAELTRIGNNFKHKRKAANDRDGLGLDVSVEGGRAAFKDFVEKLVKHPVNSERDLTAEELAVIDEIEKAGEIDWATNEVMPRGDAVELDEAKDEVKDDKDDLPF